MSGNFFLLSIVTLSLCCVALGGNIPCPKENCNPNRLYDTTLVYVSDTMFPADPNGLFNGLFNSLNPEKNTTEFYSAAINFFKEMYGLDFSKPVPNWTFLQLSTASTMDYHIIGVSTPGYPHAFPVTDLEIEDDFFMPYSTADTMVYGSYAPEGEAVMAGTVLLFGKYTYHRTGETTPFFPVVDYFAPMPMPLMFMPGGYSMTIDCVLISPLWGRGSVKGVSTVMQMMGDDMSMMGSGVGGMPGEGDMGGMMNTTMISLQTRAVATFPESLVDRMTRPKQTQCKNL
jgi:hypothetical protein